MQPETFFEVWKKGQAASNVSFEEDVFWQVLYPHARPFAKIMWYVWRPYFRKDLDLIKRIGSVTSAQEANNEIDNARYQKPEYGLFRRNLRLRVSGKRLISLVKKSLKPRDTGLQLDAKPSNPVNSEGCFPSIS